MTGDVRVTEAIREIVRRLVAQHAPQKIILFGSYAYGEPDEDSDIDLLIIEESERPFLERMDLVRRAVTGAHPRIPFEPIVLTPEEVDRRIGAGDQFIAEIIENGEVLYAA